MGIDPAAVAQLATDAAHGAANVAAIVDAAGVPEVKVTGWTATTYGVWGLFGLALMRIAPDLYGKWIGRDAALRTEQGARRQTTEQRLVVLEDRMGRTQLALGFVTNAVTVATGALDSDDHEERARAQQQALGLVKMAALTLGANDPFTDALEQLAQVAGTTRAFDGVSPPAAPRS